MTIFYIEQTLLALQSGGIADKTAIGANDPRRFHRKHGHNCEDSGESGA